MRKILTIILLLSLTFSYGQEKITSDKLTLNYDIKYLKSKYYPDEERVLKVFLPENYDASRKYPVIYTLDGESLFKTLAQNISILQDKGVVCGYRIEDIAEEFYTYKCCRQLEKLIDELAKGRQLEKILRTPK